MIYPQLADISESFVSLYSYSNLGLEVNCTVNQRLNIGKTDEKHMFKASA